MILRRWLASVKTRLRGAAAEQETLLQDLRYGARILHRSPRFTVAVVLILGVGVAMTTQARRVQIAKPDGGQRPLGIPATP